jgi:hypothetical protein
VEKLIYIHIDEVEGKGNYALSFQLTAGGGGISLRRGDQADWVIIKLRKLADLLERGVKDRIPKDSELKDWKNESNHDGS